MSGERLVPVKSFDELRAGMKVVVKDCGWCGRAHAMMLVVLREEETDGPCGGADDSTGWEALPAPACCPPDVPGVLVTWESVALGLLYRVVYGLETESSTTTEAVRPLETVR